MSLILDALNRSERERRESDRVPSLQSVHAPAREQRDQPNQRRRVERWLLVLVLAILSVDFIVGRWQQRTAVVESAPAPQAASRGELPPAPVVSGAVPSRPPRAEAEVATEVVTEVQAESAPMPGLAEDVAQKREIEALYRGQILQPRVEPEPRAQPRRRPPAAQAPGDGDIAALLARARAPDANAANPYLSVPYITELPADVRSRIPTLNYSEHNLGSAVGEHRVRINGQLLAAGQALSSDLKLLGIYPEGVILSFQGTRFRLEALNRWVNF